MNPAPASATTAAPAIQPAPTLAPPVATIIKGDTPIVASINSSTPTSLSFGEKDSGGRTNQIAITVPVGAISGAGTLEVALAEPNSENTSTTQNSRGFVAISVVIRSSENYQVRQLLKPLTIKFAKPNVAGTPAVSSDGGVTWQAITQTNSQSLSTTDGTGYYLGDDHNIYILAAHLSLFDMLNKQNSLFITAPKTTLNMGEVMQLGLRGGSGDGEILFSSFTRDVCTVTHSGDVVPISEGACIVNLSKGGDQDYLAISASPKTIWIKP